MTQTALVTMQTYFFSLYCTYYNDSKDLPSNHETTVRPCGPMARRLTTISKSRDSRFDPWHGQMKISFCPLSDTEAANKHFARQYLFCFSLFFNFVFTSNRSLFLYRNRNAHWTKEELVHSYIHGSLANTSLLLLLSS